MTKLFLILIFFYFQAAGFCAEEKKLSPRVFVVETDAQSSAESLNRISGKIDLGFSAPDQTFTSPDHYAPGPLARQRQSEQSKTA